MPWLCKDNVLWYIIYLSIDHVTAAVTMISLEKMLPSATFLTASHYWHLIPWMNSQSSHQGEPDIPHPPILPLVNQPPTWHLTLSCLYPGNSKPLRSTSTQQHITVWIRKTMTNTVYQHINVKPSVCRLNTAPRYWPGGGWEGRDLY